MVKKQCIWAKSSKGTGSPRVVIINNLENVAVVVILLACRTRVTNQQKQQFLLTLERFVKGFDASACSI